MSQPIGARASTQRGCNLFEILVLLTLLSLIMTGVCIVAGCQLARARRAETLHEMRALEAGVVLWQSRTGGACPPSMAALVRGKILNREPRDGWRRPLRFARCSPQAVAIYSTGPDGKPHTRDDVLSWAVADPRWVTAPPPARPRKTGPAIAFVAGLVLLIIALRRLPLTLAREAPG